MKEIRVIIKRKEGEKVYVVPFTPKMRILEALFYIQENLEPDLGFRWNCGEGICGSCAAEVNGKPVLMCKTEIKENVKEIRLEPMKVFPVIKDLVTNPEQVYKKQAKLKPYFNTKDRRDSFYKIFDSQIEEVQEMRKCIDCFICYDSCHVIRNHPELKFPGPINVLKSVSLDKHPKEELDRGELLSNEGVWNCNVSGCCTENCPQDIKITDDAMIFSKEKAISKSGLIKSTIKKLRKGEW